MPRVDPLRFLAVLWELDHALEAASSRMQAELGVTAQQRMVLRFIGKRPKISPGQLAGILRIHPGTLSTALARLEKRGLVARKRDPADHRRVALALTPKGRRLDVPTARTVESAVARVLARVSSGDLQATVRCVQAVIDELNADAVSSASIGRVS